MVFAAKRVLTFFLLELLLLLLQLSASASPCISKIPYFCNCKWVSKTLWILEWKETSTAPANIPVPCLQEAEDILEVDVLQRGMENFTFRQENSVPGCNITSLADDGTIYCYKFEMSVAAVASKKDRRINKLTGSFS